MHERRGCFTYLLLGFIWLYVLFMSSAHFRVNLRSIVAWIPRNLLPETGPISIWMFVHKLSGCGLESCCSLWGLFLKIFLAPNKNDRFCLVFVFLRGMPIGILKYILYFINADLNISWIFRYNSILGPKSGFHNTVFYSVYSWAWLYISNMRWIEGKFRQKQIYLFWVFWNLISKFFFKRGSHEEHTQM